MKFCFRDSVIDWRIVLLVIGICSLHILTLKIEYIAYAVSFMEICILFFLLLKQRLDLFLYTEVILLSTTFEFSMFVDSSLDSVPSIVNLPFVKGYFFVFLSLFPVFKLFRGGLLKHFSFNKSLYYFVLFAFITMFSGIVMGILSLFIDATSSSFRIVFMFKDIINVGLFSLYLLYFAYSMIHYEGFKEKLKIVLFSTLVPIIIVAFFFTLVGFSGDYESREIILMPLSFLFSTFIIVFWYYKEYRCQHWFLLFVLSLLAFYMQLEYSNALGGKSWLVFFLLALLSLYFSYKKSKMLFGGIIVGGILFFSTLVGITERKLDGDTLASSKLSQAILLVSVVDMDWYDKLPLSPKIRIEEFFNTVLEYRNHPFYLLFGKGYGGGHWDYRNAYGSYNPAAFSLEEYSAGYFIALHESLNTVFLKFGLIGILLLCFIVYHTWKYIEISPWLIVGGIWFILFWGYSFSLMAIGLPALLIGLREVENKQKTILINKK